MRKIIISCFFLVFFIINLVLVLTNHSFVIDNGVYNFLTTNRNVTMTNIFIILTFLGSTLYIVILNIAIFVYTILRKKYQYSLFLANSLTSVLANNILKAIVQRPRPDVLRLVTETGYSYPSGHTMIAILFYGTIIYFLFKYKVKGKWLVTSVLVLLMIGIAVSRIYLGVHYASDVIGGILIAISLILITTTLHESLIEKEWLKLKQ